VSASGEEYLELRAAILDGGVEAREMLEAVSAEGDWRSQALARALRARIEEPQLCRHYEELMAMRVGRAAGPVSPAYQELLLSALGPTDAEGEGWVSATGLRSPQAVPFLLEVLLQRSAVQPPCVVSSVPPEARKERYTIDDAAACLNVTSASLRQWVREASPMACQSDKDSSIYLTPDDLDRIVRDYPERRGDRSRPELYGRLARSLAAAMLGASNDPLVVPALGHALRADERGSVRYCAAAALGATGRPEASAPLMAALQDESPSVRREAVGALGALGCSDAVPALVGMLQDPERYVRMAVPGALGMIGGERAVEQLAGVLGDGQKEKGLRERAAVVLGEAGDRRAVQALLRALVDPEATVRARSVFALGETADPCAVEPLLGCLGDADWLVRVGAARALGRLESESAVGPLATLLAADGRAPVRRAAAKALGDIGGKAAVEPLIEALNDADGAVRRRARLSLRVLTGQHHGQDAAAWLRWWEEGGRSDYDEGRPE
jgi:HEAT repeat protein